MSALITIFKTEFRNKEDVRRRLDLLSKEVKEDGESYVYSIHSGNLFRFIHLLHDHKVVYRTHFDNVEKT